MPDRVPFAADLLPRFRRGAIAVDGMPRRVPSRCRRGRPAWVGRARGVLIGIVAAAPILTACSYTPQRAGTQSITTAQAPRLIVVATAATSEPAPRLPTAVHALLVEMGRQAREVGGASVALVTAGRQPVVVDMTPLRGQQPERNGRLRDRKVAAAVVEFERLVIGQTAARDGLDLLGLLDSAARLAPGAPIVVLSSGVSTVAPLDLRRTGWPDTRVGVGTKLRQVGLLPRYLGGREITFYYLGDTAGKQPSLPGTARAALASAYLDICTAVKARCTVADDAPDPAANRGTRLVPVVPVPALQTVHLTACKDLVRLPNVLLFAPDSAVLTRDADAALRPVVDMLAASHGSLRIGEIAGHTADAGPGNGMALSRERARVVADALRRLGVPALLISSVTGYGDTRPVVADRARDGSLTAAAYRNRRVEITLLDSGCTG